MRLWHQKLIPVLPRQQLLGQHRECCALRGKSWDKKHAIVDYVFTHSPEKLFRYHELVMQEMEDRGYRVDPLWKDRCYRGKNCEPYNEKELLSSEPASEVIYPEHDDAYLGACLDNLHSKGIVIDPN